MICNLERCCTVGPAWQSLWTPWDVISSIPAEGEGMVVVEEEGDGKVGEGEREREVVGVLEKTCVAERDVARTDIVRVGGWDEEGENGEEEEESGV